MSTWRESLQPRENASDQASRSEFLYLKGWHLYNTIYTHAVSVRTKKVKIPLNSFQLEGFFPP